MIRYYPHIIVDAAIIKKKLQVDTDTGDDRNMPRSERTQLRDYIGGCVMGHIVNIRTGFRIFDDDGNYIKVPCNAEVVPVYRRRNKYSSYVLDTVLSTTSLIGSTPDTLVANANCLNAAGIQHIAKIFNDPLKPLNLAKALAKSVRKDSDSNVVYLQPIRFVYNSYPHCAHELMEYPEITRDGELYQYRNIGVINHIESQFVYTSDLMAKFLLATVPKEVMVVLYGALKSSLVCKQTIYHLRELGRTQFNVLPALDHCGTNNDISPYMAMSGGATVHIRDGDIDTSEKSSSQPMPDFIAIQPQCMAPERLATPHHNTNTLVNSARANIPQARLKPIEFWQHLYARYSTCRTDRKTRTEARGMQSVVGDGDIDADTNINVNANYEIVAVTPNIQFDSILGRYILPKSAYVIPTGSHCRQCGILLVEFAAIVALGKKIIAHVCAPCAGTIASMWNLAKPSGMPLPEDAILRGIERRPDYRIEDRAIVAECVLYGKHHITQWRNITNMDSNNTGLMMMCHTGSHAQVNSSILMFLSDKIIPKYLTSNCQVHLVRCADGIAEFNKRYTRNAEASANTNTVTTAIADPVETFRMDAKYARKTYNPRKSESVFRPPMTTLLISADAILVDYAHLLYSLGLMTKLLYNCVSNLVADRTTMKYKAPTHVQVGYAVVKWCDDVCLLIVNKLMNDETPKKINDIRTWTEEGGYMEWRTEVPLLCRNFASQLTFCDTYTNKDLHPGAKKLIIGDGEDHINFATSAAPIINILCMTSYYAQLVIMRAGMHTTTSLAVYDNIPTADSIREADIIAKILDAEDKNIKPGEDNGFHSGDCQTMAAITSNAILHTNQHYIIPKSHKKGKGKIRSEIIRAPVFRRPQIGDDHMNKLRDHR